MPKQGDNDPPPRLPHVPREQWRSHANFPHQVLLLGSHDNFRAISAHLVNESMRAWSASPNKPPRSEHLSLFRRWKSAMKSHEGYEEHKLYVYLTARYGVDLSDLKQQHRALGRADKQVHAAFHKGDALMAAHAFKQHDEILVPHLAQEEDTVIPLLLSMQRSEFERYSRGDITALLRGLTRSSEAQERATHG